MWSASPSSQNFTTYARWVISFSESEFIRQACEWHLRSVIEDRWDRLFFGENSWGSLAVPECFGTPGSSGASSDDYRESVDAIVSGPACGYVKSDGDDEFRYDPSVPGNSDDDAW